MDYGISRLGPTLRVDLNPGVQAGMDTVARMTRVRAAAKNAFTESPSTAPPSQLAPTYMKEYILLFLKPQPAAVQCKADADADQGL